ncbi:MULTISPECIES: MarR family winged helix-turn-helix transcriptional regulator [Streptomycetaceae]|uniref:MarR family winged helix-turn-helix transcriptional regulator n=1 Tax=Streptomycetaceae TaxID=2062 RepID=UPI00035E16EB|nr:MULTISPECIES: MarR family transcriptional regulator [unclassified Streptomyces]MDX2853037.1 MarR family transcriptional regulator [Streptomyces sp. PA03-3a]MYX34251.1 MarR family transcriptional regulator [Streptomyces sp. SID8377]
MPLREPREHIGYLIWQLSQAYAIRIEHAMRPLRLTQAQFSALMQLSVHGAMSSAELARRCGVTPQSMGTAVQGLTERGLVERRAHPTHGRIIEISVTPEGEELAAHAERAIAPAEEEALSPFAPHERERVRADLQRMLATLNPHALAESD